MLRHLACLAIFALGGAGCADMHWVRNGTESAGVTHDLSECRAEALARANSPVSTPRQIDSRTDGLGRPQVMSSVAGANERSVAEHGVLSRCMHRRGYELARGTRHPDMR